MKSMYINKNKIHLESEGDFCILIDTKTKEEIAAIRDSKISRKWGDKLVGEIIISRYHWKYRYTIYSNYWKLL